MKPAALTLLAFFSLAQPRPLQPDPPHRCVDCDDWNRAQEPFRIFGNTYYVGTAGLSSVLIVSSAGAILLDGGLPQSAPLIDANIRKLGFRISDVRLILNSHAHYDHAGGIAALQRASGAVVAAREPGKRALERGEPTPDDPQFAFGRSANAFPAVSKVRVVADQEALRVGDVTITAHGVPGHTPGSTTWAWRSCDAATCYDIVYADSLNAVSADNFRFTGDATHPSRIAEFRRSIARVAALPCDIVISVHPSGIDLEGKLKRRAQRLESDPFVDPGGCRSYADGAAKRLDARISEESRAR